jgi:hypothetical protein
MPGLWRPRSPFCSVFFDQYATSLGARMAHPVEEGRKGELLHPVAIPKSEQEALDVTASFLAEYRYILRVEVRRACRDVHAELGDVEERLLAAKGVLVAGEKAAVVIELDSAKGLVLRILIALSISIVSVR